MYTYGKKNVFALPVRRQNDLFICGFDLVGVPINPTKRTVQFTESPGLDGPDIRDVPTKLALNVRLLRRQHNPDNQRKFLDASTRFCDICRRSAPCLEDMSTVPCTKDDLGDETSATGMYLPCAQYTPPRMAVASDVNLHTTLSKAR